MHWYVNGCHQHKYPHIAAAIKTELQSFRANLLAHHGLLLNPSSNGIPDGSANSNGFRFFKTLTISVVLISLPTDGFRAACSI